MALQPIAAGTRYGFIPGSQEAGVAMGYGAGYKGIASLIGPAPTWDLAAQDAQTNAYDHANQKFDLFKGLLSKFNQGGLGNGSYSSMPMNSVPAPHYASGGNVYSQSQVNAQAGLQRANLLSQAQQNTRQFTQQLGSRGFSPMSPYAMLAGQSNTMRANAGAASNETNLNMMAAQANADARAKADATNASVYGSYANALGQQNQISSQYNLQKGSQNNDLLRILLSGLQAA